MPEPKVPRKKIVYAALEPPDDADPRRTPRAIGMAINNAVIEARAPETLGGPIQPARLRSLREYTLAFVEPAFNHMEEGVFDMRPEELVFIFCAAAAFVQAKVIAAHEKDDKLASKLLQNSVALADFFRPEKAS